MQGCICDTNACSLYSLLLPKYEKCGIPRVMEATDSGEDAVIRKVGVNGMERVHGSHRDGSLH